jgi:hypothetical protein
MFAERSTSDHGLWPANSEIPAVPPPAAAPSPILRGEEAADLGKDGLDGNRHHRLL